MSKILQQPQRTSADHAHALVKAALSAVPVAGGPLAELFSYILVEPLAKRRDEWIQGIGRRLDELAARMDGPLIENLKNDPSFTTVLVDASNIAVKNHQREKLEALANAVLNAAQGLVPDDTERAIMLGLIDRLTPMHLTLLKLMQDPAKNERAMEGLRNMAMCSFNHVIVSAFPELNGRDELVKLVGRDLHDAGLTNNNSFHGSSTRQGLLEKQTTRFGDTFLQFIAGAPEAGEV